MTLRTSLSQGELNRLMKQLEPLKHGFDILNDHVMITDESANILYANKAVERNTGFSINEILGKNPADLWGGQMPDEFYEKMWQIIKGEKKPFVGEVQNKKKDGTLYWQELHISPLLDETGKVRFFIGIEPNITERKKKEQFRDEFISIVSHQLKNPLAAIRWILDFLQKDKGLSVKQRKSIETIYGLDLNLINLINDLLVVSRIGKLETNKEVTDLPQVIEKIIEEIKRQHSATSFSFASDGTIPPFYINKVLVSQIFINIIANAAEYSHKNSGKVDAKLFKEGDYYIFSCKDNGIGIPPEERERIFMKAFRASNASQAKENGSGLGLFITKTIADSLGWAVSFESTIGSGTTFFVNIPILRR